MLRERRDARKERNFHKADELLATLLEVHGVAVADSELEWWFVGDGGHAGSGYDGQGGADAGRDGHDYYREMGDDAPIAPDVLARAHALLAQRLAMKKSRRFEEADRLQDELWKLGVGVDDKERTWYYEPPHE